MAGKVVLDACNYHPQRDGDIAGLDAGRVTSSGLLQRHLSRSQVVKVFNNILAKHLRSLARPPGAADRSALPIAGDDDQDGRPEYRAVAVCCQRTTDSGRY
jgi:predicted dinucleotide-binding enzyme